MKEKMIKKVSLTALSALFAVSLSMGVATLIDTTASTADDATVFSGGASVRVQYDEATQTTDGKNGIRFATYLKGVNLSDIAGSETLVIPKDMLADGADLTDTTDGVQKVDTSNKWHTYTDKTEGEVLCAYAVLYDVPEASYSRDMVFETTVYFKDGTSKSMDYKTDEKATRSLYQVAELAQDGDEYATFSAGKKALVDAYHVKAADGTYVTYDNAVVLSAETAEVAVEETAAFWSNYYKAYNTVSLNITVAGDVADVTELTFTPDGGEAVEIPRNLLTADEEVSVPVDFAYGDFMKGTFAATVANDTTVSIQLANPTTVATKTTNAMYAYSREDKEMRLGFVNMLKNDEVTADKVLSVKYDGEYVDFTADTTGNNIVFASDILSAVEDGKTGASFEIRTVTKKYTMTKPIAHTKVFYEADDLFVTYDNGTTYYSYFDMSVDDDRFEPLTPASGDNLGTSATGLAAKGTYALGADIDLTEETRVLWHANPMQTITSQTNLNKNSGTWIGLTGDFYGYAHTITGMTVGKGGLFGHIGRGMVRDVSFKDVKYSTNENSDMNKYASILAYQIGGYENNKSTFINVHISVASVQTGAYYANKNAITDGVGANSSTYGYPAVLSYRISTASPATFTNVVVDLSALGEQINVMGFGLFGDTAINVLASAYDNMTNVILISAGGLYIGHDNKKTNGSSRLGVIYDAANQNGKATWAGTNVAFIAAGAVYDVTSDTVTFLSNESVYRFNNATEMETYITDSEVDISAFKTSGWDTWVPFLGAE